MKTSNFNTGKTTRFFGLTLAVLLAIGLNAFTVNAQTPFKNVTGSQIKVDGTSNIHDWTMSATGFSSEGICVLNGSQLQDLTALSFALPVTNLKGKDDLLNTRAHKALKAELFNKITFKLTNATIESKQKIIKAMGNLTIGGVTKSVTLQASYTVDGDEITFKGSEVLKMSEYSIKPPTFMMGALKVADPVTVNFILKVKN
ncbi:YceI family protein [Pedobacter sp. P351]|uniref:YceI family protein n=1 Tax=Pedobacter superstes TaxID=3133441 RepID=UPI0030AD9A5E